MSCARTLGDGGYDVDAPQKPATGVGQLERLTGVYVRRDIDPLEHDAASVGALGKHAVGGDVDGYGAPVMVQ